MFIIIRYPYAQTGSSTINVLTNFSYVYTEDNLLCALYVSHQILYKEHESKRQNIVTELEMLIQSVSDACKQDKCVLTRL